MSGELLAVRHVPEGVLAAGARAPEIRPEEPEENEVQDHARMPTGRHRPCSGRLRNFSNC